LWLAGGSQKELLMAGKPQMATGHLRQASGLSVESRGIVLENDLCAPVFMFSAMDTALWGKLSTGWTSQLLFWIPEDLTTSYG